MICRFKAVSPRIAVGSGIPAKYSRVHGFSRYDYAKLSCRAGALTSPTLTIRFNPQLVRIATARTVRKGEKKHRGSRPRRRGETCGRGRYGGAGAALAETGESRQAKRDSDWREPDEEVWKTDSTSSAWLTLYELIPLSERGYPRHFIRVCHPRVPCARRDARRPNKTTTAGVDEGKDIVLWAACQRAVSEQVDTYSGESAMKRERRENGHVVSGEREAKEKKLWTASIRRNEKIAIPFQPPPLSHPPSRFFIFFSHHVLPLRRSHCSRWRSASALDVRCDT